MVKSIVLAVLVCACQGSNVSASSQGQPTSAPSRNETTTLKQTPARKGIGAEPRFTARFAADDLVTVLEKRSDLFPLLAVQRETYTEAIRRINFGAVLERLEPHLRSRFADRWDSKLDRIDVPIATTRQVQLSPKEKGDPPYRGPKTETIGFLIHDLTEPEYVATVLRVLHTARQLLDA